MTDNLPTRELPAYKCHKEVQALQIRKIVYRDGGAAGAELYFYDLTYSPVEVSAEWLASKKPQPDWYFVVYPKMPGEERAYSSCSPPLAFTSGYEPINATPPAVNASPTDEELRDMFLYHPPQTHDQIERHALVSEWSLELARKLRDLCPGGPDLQIAFILLAFARMQANTAIARNHDKLPVSVPLARPPR